MSYAALQALVEDSALVLAGLGLNDTSRIAFAAPNGPEETSLFLALAANAVAAPLNPAFGAAELEQHLDQLGITAVVVEPRRDGALIEAARRGGLRVIERTIPDGAVAGQFLLDGRATAVAAPVARESAEGRRIALLLQTSGTTSRPKVVPLSDENLCASAGNIAASLALGGEDCCLAPMPLYHVHGLVGSVLATLASGGSILCPGPFDAIAYLEALSASGATWSSAVPTMYQAVLAELGRRGQPPRHALRLLRSASSSLPLQVLAALEEVFGVPVIEAYGMTEASNQICANPLPPLSRKPGSVGLATGCEVVVLGSDGGRLPAGESGEIAIRGAGVTAGYEANIDANASAFVEGWFKTGDLGHLDEDGYLWLSGRLKEIINRGGENIAPREIDEVLLAHPAVSDAVAFAAPHDTLGEDVAAVVVLRPQARANEADLRAFAAERLADFKVPRRIILADEIPKGPTGKVRRNDLARQLDVAAPGRAPRSPAATPPPGRRAASADEVAMAEIWSQVLGPGEVGLDDDFFHLGGDSLSAARLLARIRATFGTELAISAVFESPTPATLLAAALAAKVVAAPAIGAVPPGQRGTLSASQVPLWHIQQGARETCAYNMQNALRLVGPLQRSALERSLCEILRRHEVLRTNFVEVDGEVRAAVRPATAPDLVVTDLSALRQGFRQAEIEELAAADVKKPFDLATDPLLRLRLLRLGPQEHLLLWTVHHIVWDGWSRQLFDAQLMQLYGDLTDGRPPSLPEPEHKYDDYAAWQAGAANAAANSRQLDYWKRQLAGPLPVLELPSDHPRPAVAGEAGASCRFMLPMALSEALKRLGREQGATLFMTLAAAFKVLLARHCGQEDVVLAFPVAGRNRVETENLIGLFVNRLPLRGDLSGDPPFHELLQRVRSATLGALEHQDVPFWRIVEAVKPARTADRAPLCQVLFQLRERAVEPAFVAGLRSEPVDLDSQVSRLDLSLAMREQSDGLKGEFIYNSDLFDGATISRLARHFTTLLQGIVGDPACRLSRLPILSAEERQRILVQWNDTAVDYGDKQFLHQQFEKQAALRPSAMALECGGQCLTYAELNKRANRLAHDLIARGIAPGTPVGVCLDRSVELVVALLAILKAGAAYLPLPTVYPASRLAFMQEDSGAAWVLSVQRFSELCASLSATVLDLDVLTADSARFGEANPNLPVGPEDAAYVIYTSGSTGLPKAVIARHRGATNTVNFMRDELKIGPEDRFAQISSFAWDASIRGIFGSLACGGRLVFFDENEAGDPERMLRRIRDSRATVVTSIVAPLVDAMPESPEDVSGSDLRICAFGGEKLGPGIVRKARRLFGGQVEFFNFYGPTECTQVQSYHRLPPGSALPADIPIGRPLANNRIYILDRHLEPVPAGVYGELYISGAGLVDGYLNRPELTAERFLAVPFPQDPFGRMYKTGDVGRFHADGTIEIAGRDDDQINIRGLRVEPGEIEACLAEHPGIEGAVVLARPDRRGEPRLVAYLLRAAGAEVSTGELRDYLRVFLPNFMVPASLVFVDAFPLLHNGKLDRKALPDPEDAGGASGTHYQEPRNPTEELLVGIWAELLGLERVDVCDDFFACGGHSLLAARMFRKVEQVTGIALPIATLFQGATVEYLAARLREHDSALMQSSITQIQGGTGLPLFFLHGDYAGGGLYCRNLARHLGTRQAFVAVAPHGLDGAALPDSIEEMAAARLRDLRAVQPAGPYLLGGHCNGGLVALELANQLRAEGEEVALLVLVDTPSYNAGFFAQQARRVLEGVDAACGSGFFGGFLEIQHALWKFRRFRRKLRTRSLSEHLSRLDGFAARRRRTEAQPHAPLRAHYRRVMNTYLPKPYAGRITCMVASEGNRVGSSHPGAWRNIADDVEVRTIAEGHFAGITTHVENLAAELRACLDDAGTHAGSPPNK